MKDAQGHGSNTRGGGATPQYSLAADQAALEPFRGMKASVALGMLNLIHQHRFDAAHQQGTNDVPRRME